MVSQSIRLKPPPGRPRKFREPSRAVTLTLPVRILEDLARIGPDRARAIVAAVDRMKKRRAKIHRHLEVVEMAPGVHILILPPTRFLAQIPWLKLIEVAPARFVLTIEPGTPIERIEVALTDLLETRHRMNAAEAGLLDELKTRIGDLRRRGWVSKAEILVVRKSR